MAPPPAVPPAVPPENTPLNPTGDDMDDDLLEEATPPATKRKGEFGVIHVPTNRQEFQQWTAGLDRESVREGLLHFLALHEQHEREEHARQAEAMERASASGTVADDENPSVILKKEDFFNSGKEKRSEKERKREELCKERKDFKEAFFQEDRGLRSGPKLSSFDRTPFFFFIFRSQARKI